MSKNKTVLGKGLGALIPGAETERTEPVDISTLIEERVVDVPYLEIGLISPNPFQPRKDFPETELEELTASIREHGIIQPVTVRKEAGGKYMLIAGERRLRAAERAGLRKIPAFVLDVDSDRKMLELSIIENVQRQDLNPIEEAESFKRLIDECGLRQDEVAERISKDRTTVSNFLRLLKLPVEIKDSLRKGELGMGHAKAIMVVPEPEHQIDLWRAAVKDNYSVRRLEELARRAATDIAVTRGVPARKKTGRPLKTSVPGASGVYTPVETELKQKFKTQVRIRTKTESSGEIAIEYYSTDELERLAELLLSIRGE
jgi:ParB family chromosome partitioning protein